MSYGNQCSQAVAGFEKEWSWRFSRYPSPTKLADNALRTQMLGMPELSTEVRGYLEEGGSPLALGNEALLTGLRSAYRKIIDHSDLKDAAKLELRNSLDRAVEDLNAQNPVPRLTLGLVSGGGGEGGGGDGPRELTEKEWEEKIGVTLDREALKRCVVRSSILFTVSTLINTATALQVKWQQYAGTEHRGFFAKLGDPATWGNAWSDPHFRHNVTWNGILMVALGGLSCMRNKALGKKLLAAITAASSAAGQYFSTGKISVTQTAFDVLFVRIISVNKSNAVFYLSERYAARGLPVPLLAESGMQMVSEGLGGTLYPRANAVYDWLLGKQ